MEGNGLTRHYRRARNKRIRNLIGVLRTGARNIIPGFRTVDVRRAYSEAPTGLLGPFSATTTVWALVTVVSFSTRGIKE